MANCEALPWVCIRLSTARRKLCAKGSLLRTTRVSISPSPSFTRTQKETPRFAPSLIYFWNLHSCLFLVPGYSCSTRMPLLSCLSLTCRCLPPPRMMSPHQPITSSRRRRRLHFKAFAKAFLYIPLTTKSTSCDLWLCCGTESRYLAVKSAGDFRLQK